MSKTVTLQLSIEQVNVVLAGIAKLPLEASLQTFQEVQKQASAQLQEAPQGPLSDKVMN